jgi:hypothetical protein
MDLARRSRTARNSKSPGPTSAGLGVRSDYESRLERVQIRSAGRKRHFVPGKPLRTDLSTGPRPCGSNWFRCFRRRTKPGPTAVASTSWRNWQQCVRSSCAFPEAIIWKGKRIETRFDWKKMIGPLVERPTQPTTWTYYSSDGMVLLEFLMWCEDLGMEPLLGVYACYSLGGQGPVRAVLQSDRGKAPKHAGDCLPVKGTTPDLVDDHYYKRAQGVRERRSTTRPIERAPKSKWRMGDEGTDPTPNLSAALGDAAFLTGL